MRRAALAYVAAAATVLALDAVWLTLTGPMYRSALGDLLTAGFRPAPAAVFYALYIAGLCRLAVWPALASGGLGRAALDGAVFGLIAYATYDLTNAATLSRWPAWLAAMDMGWGAILSAAGAAAGYLAASRLSRRTRS